MTTGGTRVFDRRRAGSTPTRPRSVGNQSLPSASRSPAVAGVEDGQLICVTPLENPLPGTRVRLGQPEKLTELSLGQPK